MDKYEQPNKATLYGPVWDHVSRGGGRRKPRIPPNAARYLLIFLTASDSTTVKMNYEPNFTYRGSLTTARLPHCAVGDRSPKQGLWVQPGLNEPGWAHTCQARCIQVTKKAIDVPSALSVVSKVSGYLKQASPWGIVVVWDARGIALYVFLIVSWNCAAPFPFILCHIFYYSSILHDAIRY